jgi:NAD(P)-dependent dehydrogenase (short-subunit alcohol dehydrogenase family)
MEIPNRITLVTGPRRIGGVVALDLAKAGARVALTYKNSRKEAEGICHEIEMVGGKAMAFQADLAKILDVERVVAQVSQSWGDIDILVHLTSIYFVKAFDQLTLEDWETNLDCNLKAAYLCARAVIPGMRRKGGGRIINFADWVAASGRPRYKGFLPYYVAKCGLIGLTQALALELASDNILVNAIAPGPILPPPDLSEEENLQVRQATPLGRWGGAKEIAKTVFSLIDSNFITGECIRVDGGRHVQ